MSEDIRELAFDTETTGLHHLEGDRVIEIGAVEMINHIPTGRTFRTLQSETFCIGGYGAHHRHHG